MVNFSLKTYKLDVYQIISGEISVDEIRIDGKKLVGNEIKLNEGWHSLQFEYQNTKKNENQVPKTPYHDQRERSALVLYSKNAKDPVHVSPYADIVSMKWEQVDHLRFDPYGGKYTEWNYRFITIPGLEKMEISIYGDLKDVWIDGEKISDRYIKLIDNKSNISTYQIEISDVRERESLIALTVEPQKGYQGTLVFADVVKLKSNNSGILDAGDWSNIGALKYYSGGMYYRKKITVSEDMLGKKASLNLGKVVATCEVKINGKSLGVLISSPYEIEISEALREGDNEIEILVYSTLSNHYQSIPTPYKGIPEAGIIGPVFLSVYN